MALDRENVKSSIPGRAVSATALLAEEAHASFRDVQYGHTEGVVDLTWGHPDPSSLATDAIAAAVQHVLGDHGWQALAYGAPAGAESVRHGIAEHLSRVDAPIDSDNVQIIMGVGSRPQAIHPQTKILNPSRFSIRVDPGHKSNGSIGFFIWLINACQIYAAIGAFPRLQSNWLSFSHKFRRNGMNDCRNIHFPKADQFFSAGNLRL